MKIKLKLLIAFSFLLCTFLVRSQTDAAGTKYEVKGKITDDATGETLVGANVSYEAGKGAQTDINGNFTLLLPDGNHELKISYIGYTTITQKITVAGAPLTIERVNLASANTLDEVEIAADIAKTRETPIAFADIDSKQISEELGANDITMLLNSTPGAYASQQGGGAGDSRVNIRGFDQRNIAVLVDGVPVNDMENGQVYWSNWAGLAEVTKKMQVQRGLGASRLAVPSVGGVMNIITNSVDQKQFFTIKENLGTNNFQRYAVAYNSGLIKNKFGITLAGSYTSGDGFVDQTFQKSWSYFGKISYKINNKNLVVLGFNGAPQSHAQRSYAINMVYHNKAYAEKQGINADSAYALPYSQAPPLPPGQNPYTTTKIGERGTTYSPDWGYINGKPFNAKINFFHKPLANLSYFLTINPRTSFSNVLYYSNGTGGGTTLSSFPQYDKTGTGQLNLQGQFDANYATRSTRIAPDKKASTYYQYASMNNHNWVGTLATLKYRQSAKLEYLGGLDARYFEGTHYQTPYDMMGGDFIYSTSGNTNLAPLGVLAGPRVTRMEDSIKAVKNEGDKINYYYKSKISWFGIFGQMEYKTKKMSVFLTVTGNQTTFQVLNFFAKKDIVFGDKDIVKGAVGYQDTLFTDGTTRAIKTRATPATHNADGTVTFIDDLTKQTVTIMKGYQTFDNNSSKARTNTSRVKTYMGYTVKGGLNYKIDRNQNVFMNVGHMKLAPRFTNVFDRSGTELDNVVNQLIFTGEIGYSVKYSKVALNVNGYMTSWGNKPLDFGASTPDPLTNANIYYNINGVDAILKGIEMDMSYKPVKFLDFKVFGTLADWKWNSGGITSVYNDVGTLVEKVDFDAKGVHVGNAPQRQLGASVRYEIRKGFYIKPQFTYFDKMYAQFDPTKLVYDEKNNKDYKRTESWRMPAYGLFDLYMGYRISANNVKVEITASMNNVLNTVYMSDATFVTNGPASSPEGITPDKYDAAHSTGWMGLGRRINIGVKVTF